MKILGICGSPREGNTEFMLKTVLEAAGKKGAETELILLREQNIKHCAGCSRCQKKPYKCIIKDDAWKVNEKLKEAGVIVFASPTYFDNVTGLFKDFIDRTHPLYAEKRLKDKKAGVCTIGAGDLKSVEKAAQAIERFCEAYEMEIVNVVCVVNDGITPNQKKLKKLGEQLA